jgi:SAM-dependent methyltransferase
MQTSMMDKLRGVQRWDRLSKNFGKAGAAGGDQLKECMFSMLKERNILREGMRILDLGCGTGRFTIPFAQMGADVTAVDISSGMLRRLEDEIPPELAPRITFMQLDWHQANLDHLGFRSSFDLSLAHMTPAITGPETFLKFSSTSRQWAVLVAWAGARRQNTMEQVWRRLTGKELDQDIRDIIFSFNLLYSMGYCPSIDFQHRRIERKVAIEEETDILTDLFHESIEHNKQEVKKEIFSCLQGMAQEGEVQRLVTGRIGRMIWEVNI